MPSSKLSFSTLLKATLESGGRLALLTSLILPTTSSGLLPGPHKPINTVLTSQLNTLVFAQKEKENNRNWESSFYLS